jgi:hypothetical protein
MVPTNPRLSSQSPGQAFGRGLRISVMPNSAAAMPLALRVRVEAGFCHGPASPVSPGRLPCRLDLLLGNREWHSPPGGDPTFARPAVGSGPFDSFRPEKDASHAHGSGITFRYGAELQRVNGTGRTGSSSERPSGHCSRMAFRFRNTTRTRAFA